MKFAEFLKQDIIRLKAKYGTTSLRYSTKHEDLRKRIEQLVKLTPFCNNKHKTLSSVSSRLHYVGKKNIDLCKLCGSEISTFGTITCGRSCAVKLKHIMETPENKLARVTKAAKTRDYTDIQRKRANTMKQDIDESGNNAFRRAALKAAETMRDDIDETGHNGIERRTSKIASIKTNDIDKHGLNSYQRAAHKISATRKRIYVDEMNHWNTCTDNVKSARKESQRKTARKTNEDNGRWRKIEDVSGYEIYFKDAAFRHGFEFNSLTTDTEKELLRDHGVFDNKSNTKGCVRDHLLSRRYGYDNNVPPEIISHPANCEIVLHSENVRRRSVRDGDDQITLEQLMERINKFDRNANKL